MDVARPVAYRYGPLETGLGMALGAAFIKVSQEFLHQYEGLSFASITGADARKTLLIIGIMTVHAIGEGSGVGVSFSGQGGWSQVRYCSGSLSASPADEGASRDSIDRYVDPTCVEHSTRMSFAWCPILSRRPSSESHTSSHLPPRASFQTNDARGFHLPAQTGARRA